MSSRTKEINENYLQFCRLVLKDHPSLSVVFEDHWVRGDFRAAYVLVDKIIHASYFAQSEQFKKADQEFYWEFIA